MEETGEEEKGRRKRRRRRKMAKETDEEQRVLWSQPQAKKTDVTELLTHLQELLPSQRGSQNGKSEKDNCQCEPGGRESPQERTKT